MISYKFYINDIEVEEPHMFDGLELSLERSQNYTGLENVFTETTVTFIGKAAKLITDEFNLNGFDGSLIFKIDSYCNRKFESSSTWRLNLMHYSNMEGMITIKASEPGFQTKFKNRLDIKVSLDSNRSIGGTALPPAPFKTIGLHSKAIVKTGKIDFETVPFVENHVLTDFFNNPSYYVVPTFNRITTDFDTLLLPTSPTTKNSNETIAYLEGSPIFYSPFGGKYRITIRFEHLIETSNHESTFLRFIVGTGLNTGETTQNDVLLGFTDTGTISKEFRIGNFYDITLLPGQALWIAYLTTFTGVVGDSVVPYKITTIGDSYITVEDLQVTVDPSECRAMLIHDAFQRVCELITDQPGSFKSDFFGLKETYPFFQSDGCGGLLTVTNGKNIRNMLQKDGTAFPISMSFQELFKACDAVFNLGMRIEIDNYGRGVVRVEPKWFFFYNQPFTDFDNVSGITIEPAMEYIFKSIEVGYNKWNLNQGSVNGIDEFNTSHVYSLPVENSQNKIEAKSSFIASGYAIELTRRVQYESSPTSDFETDDENFFVCVVRDGKNFKSETNENFDDVQNLISPETAYNLRISPARNLLRWWGYISPSIYYKIKQNAFTAIQFESGEGNVLMRSKQSGGCVDSADVFIQENQNINQTHVMVPSELFIPVKLSFTYPLTIAQFNEIRKNSNRSIKVSCSNVSYIAGGIEKCLFKPNGPNGGIGEFTILALGRQEAAFDYGFTLGFTS